MLFQLLLSSDQCITKYSVNQPNALSRASGFALVLLSQLSWAKERRHPRSVARGNVRKNTAIPLKAAQPCLLTTASGSIALFPSCAGRDDA
jgi:hypothetical protein